MGRTREKPGSAMRGKGIEQVWARLESNGMRIAQEREAERDEATNLLVGLQGLANGAREELVWSDCRYQTLAVAEGLLQCAEDTLPTEAAGLAGLALQILESLDRGRYGSEIVIGRATLARCLKAEAHRRQGDLGAAVDELSGAERRLGELPLDAWERALYCRQLAKLRCDQERLDEALGLLGRAADLFNHWKQVDAAAEVLSEAADLWLEANDPESALAIFLELKKVVDPDQWPLLAIRVRQGVALSYGQLCQPILAEKALKGARALYALAPGSRLRFMAAEARIAEEMGKEARAIQLLRPLVGEFLLRGEDFEAAQAVLALARLFAAGGSAEALRYLIADASPLLEPERLPAPVALALRFALRVVTFDQRDWYELLSQLSDYLRRARTSPRLEWRWGSTGWTEVPWEAMDEALRRRLCEEAGLPVTRAAAVSSALSSEERHLLTWTFQALHSTTVRFEAKGDE